MNINFQYRNIVEIIRRLMITCAFLLILSSCEINSVHDDKVKIRGKGEFDDHTYLELCMNKRIYLIHDPDCKCKENDE